ncbi:MAG: hypothetical protein MJ213_06010, partial [Bacilli bacterium]|nr:hypothetical protein [Bacilli bacterium]
MKNLNFKDFSYAMINSAMSGYREVLVTYTVDGKIVHKCLFIEEVKGKDKNYYFAQAKKEIDASIKDGSLAKSASKQLRHGATKPVLITLSCVLAAGALGTGGYFLGSYLGGGGGSPVVTDGHTVVLYGGEGVFENHKTYLIFNNVKDKTPLGDIEGYALPAYEDYDFLKWNGPIEDQPYGTSFKITEDIVLTASFFEGIKYLKAQAINSINVELKYLLDNYILDKSVKEMLNNIYEKSRSVINNIEESTDTAAVDDAKNTITDLKECANEMLDIVASTAAIYPESAAEIEKTYENALNSLVKEKSISKRAALVKFNSGYIKAASGATDITIVDKTYDELTKMLSDYDEEADSLNIRLLGRFAKGVIAGSAYFTDPKQIEKIIEDLLYWFEQLAAAGLKEDDTNTIDWVGEFFNYYYYASSRYDYLDPQIEPL